MKYKIVINLIFMLLVVLSCSDQGDNILTCSEEDLDCEGVCGGSAILDECGICNGNGLNEYQCCGDINDCILYNPNIQNIFQSHCIDCHNDENTSGSLNLLDYNNLNNVIIKNDPLGSILYQKVLTGAMPPSYVLSEEDINLIYQWISEGAHNN